MTLDQIEELAGLRREWLICSAGGHRMTPADERECFEALPELLSMARQLIRAREVAAEMRDYLERFQPTDDMGHPLQNLKPLRALLNEVDGAEP
jgi:hypothetical protein